MDLLLNLGIGFAGLLASLIFYRKGKKDASQISESMRRLEQRVEQYFLKDVRRVDEAISEFIDKENSTSEMVEEVVESSAGQPRDTWTKLLLIRIILRVLLRRIAEARGIPVTKTTAGINTLNDKLAVNQVIDATLQEHVERIRDATFTAEWPLGDPPDPDNVPFTLEHYKDVFTSLKGRMRSK